MTMSNPDIEVAKKTIDREIEALKVMENGLDDTLSKALYLLQCSSNKLIC